MTPSMLDEQCTLMRERTAVLIALQRSQLNTEWIQQFPIRALADCCGRIARVFKEPRIFSLPIQRELIQNPAFASFLASLLQRLPDGGTPTDEDSELPQGEALREQGIQQLSVLLVACHANGCCITDFELQNVLDVFALDAFSGEVALVFLKNFAPLHLPPETRQLVVRNIRCCASVPIVLNDFEKSLLQENFIGTCDVFEISTFRDVASFFEANPSLLDCLRFLYEKGIPDCLGLDDYKRLSATACEYLHLLKVLEEKVGVNAMSRLLRHWSRSNCSMQELHRAERQISRHPELDYDAVLKKYSSYINLLYGICFKTIDLAQVSDYQERVLTYAITHGKKHFIRIVDENAEQFLWLPRNSLLFAEKLYSIHLNLNELSAADLRDLAWMTQQHLSVPELVPGRVYTFQELKALYDTPKEYVKLYHLLSSSNLDYRLLVLRQLKKRNVLKEMADDELETLADRLDEKPLYHWLHQDFGHIAGLNAHTCVKMLVHLEKLRHLIPSFRNMTDAALALCNLSALDKCETIEYLKSNIALFNEDWRSLAKAMNISRQFIQQHRESIMAFLCRNGASIAHTYLENLEEHQKDAYLRIVKAELMGRFYKLKYHEGDLQKELDRPIRKSAEELWERNAQMDTQTLHVQECDDFFSTMLVGLQPHRTCLSYVDGRYLHCLLSSFDSNKKILYASQNGRIVGRAFLRLTKCRLNSLEKEEGEEFTFANVEDVSEPSEKEQSGHEDLALFLERPYIAGVSPQDEAETRQAFIDLASAKADEMGVMLVLSGDYRNTDPAGFTWTLFNIYISKSKAGSQYLDSLGGSAEVSDAGHYRTNRFFLRKPQHVLPIPTVQH